jgi:hypothetical protein
MDYCPAALETQNHHPPVLIIDPRMEACRLEGSMHRQQSNYNAVQVHEGEDCRWIPSYSVEK